MILRRLECSCEGLWLSSNGRTHCLINMVWKNLHRVYFSKVGASRKFRHTMNYQGISCRNPCGLFVQESFFGLLYLHLLSWSGLGQSRPLRQMKDLTLQWSQAFDIVCELSLIIQSLESTIDPSGGQHFKYTTVVIMMFKERSSEVGTPNLSELKRRCLTWPIRTPCQTYKSTISVAFKSLPWHLVLYNHPLVIVKHLPFLSPKLGVCTQLNTPQTLQNVKSGAKLPTKPWVFERLWR